MTVTVRPIADIKTMTATVRPITDIKTMAAMVRPITEITTMTVMEMAFKIARIVVRTTRAATEYICKLHGALDEEFHSEGGLRYLSTLFPKGTVAQGCLLAGLKLPAAVQDKGFGRRGTV